MLYPQDLELRRTDFGSNLQLGSTYHVFSFTQLCPWTCQLLMEPHHVPNSEAGAVSETKQMCQHPGNRVAPDCGREPVSCQQYDHCGAIVKVKVERAMASGVGIDNGSEA